jgi:hypothetical protein
MHAGRTALSISEQQCMHNSAQPAIFTREEAGKMVHRYWTTACLRYLTVKEVEMLIEAARLMRIRQS